MNLADLQKEAHAIAKDHGWWDEERTFGDSIAEVHSELSEALEAYRLHGLKDWRSHTYDDGFVDEHPHGEKPEGVASELADVVIRVADIAEHYEENLEVYVRATPTLAYEGNTSTFGEWIAVIHKQLSDAWGAWYVQEDRCLWVNALARAVALTYRMAAHYGIDLDAAIEAKMEYNRTRPYRHGGKAL